MVSQAGRARDPWRRAAGAAIALACLVVVIASGPACSQGEGDGRISGTLNVPNCWTGAFELNPDFLAAVPYREGMLLRIQSGSDFQTFSDGVTILLNDISKVRPDPSRQFAGKYREPLAVDLPPEV